jgi:hypothetical protein
MGSIEPGQPKTDAIGDRAANAAIHIDEVETAILNIDVSGKLIRRLLDDELYQSARRIPSEERALGTFEYFHPLEIERRQRLSLLRRNVSLIGINGDGRFNRVVEIALCNAPDAELRTFTAGTA